MRISRRSALSLIRTGGLAAVGVQVSGLLSPVHAESAVGWNHREVRLPLPEGSESPPIVTALAIRPDGKRVALAGDDHAIRIWDVPEHKVTGRLTAHQDLVRTLAYSPDGASLASAGNDGHLVIWNASTGQVVRSHNQRYPFTRITFCQRGMRLASIGYRSPLRLFDVSTGSEIRALKCPCADMRTVAISPDNRFIAAGGRNGVVRIWNLNRGEVLHEFAAHKQRIRALEFSPDSQRLASASDDRSLRVSQLDGGQAVVFRGRTKLLSLAFCGPGQIATGGSDNVIRIWDVAGDHEESELQGHTGSVAALAYANGTLASAGFDTRVLIWKRVRNVAADGGAIPSVLGRRTETTRSR